MRCKGILKELLFLNTDLLINIRYDFFKLHNIAVFFYLVHCNFQWISIFYLFRKINTRYLLFYSTLLKLTNIEVYYVHILRNSTLIFVYKSLTHIILQNHNKLTSGKQITRKQKLNGRISKEKQTQKTRNLIDMKRYLGKA